MLTRIISGAVGVIILIGVLFFHGTVVLPIAVAAMIAIMLYELLRAVKLEKNIPILIAAELCGISTPFVCALTITASKRISTITERIYAGVQEIHFMPYYEQTLTAFRILQFAIVLAAAFAIFITWLRHHKELRYEQIFFALAVMVLVPQAMSCIVRIERMDDSDGLFLLVMGLCGAWIADTGAYFTGVALGKHKLCPEISPKKTVEGFVGGIAVTGIVFAVAFTIYTGKVQVVQMLLEFVMGAVCAVIGTVGDLSASMVKRQIGFKDYGKIMPGHGGMMDRFDSVLFVLPTFYVMTELLKLLNY